MKSEDTKYCQYCHSELKEDAEFCSKCGRKVVRVQTPDVASPTFCTYCGKGLRPGATFCDGCGRKVAPLVFPPQATQTASQLAQPRPPYSPTREQPLHPPPLVTHPKSHKRTKGAAAVLAGLVIALVAVWALSGPFSLPFLNQGPSSTSGSLQGTVGTVLTSSGNLQSRYYSFAPVASEEPGIDGYSIDAGGISTSATLTLSTFSTPDLIYLAASVASSSSTVKTIRDNSGMNWTRRTTVSASGLEVETWYAWSNEVLNADNITIALTSSAEVRAGAIAIRGALQEPFLRAPSEATGSGASPSIDLASSPQSASVYVAVLGANGDANATAGPGFFLDGEDTGPPTVALESASNFQVTHPSGNLFDNVISYSSPSASFSLATAEDWGMIGDAIAVQLNTNQGSPSSTVASTATVSADQGAPVVATCVTTSGGSVITMLMNDSEFAGLINRYSIVPMDESARQCSTFTVPLAGTYYLVIFNNQSASVTYRVESYLTYHAFSSNVIQEINALLMGAQSNTSGGSRVEAKGIIEANGTWSYELAEPDGSYLCAESGSAFLFLGPNGTGETGYLNLTVLSEHLSNAPNSPSHCGFPMVGISTEYLGSVPPTSSNPAGIVVLSPVGFTFHIPVTAQIPEPEPPSEISLNFTEFACLASVKGIQGCPDEYGSASHPWGSGVAYNYYVVCEGCENPPPVVLITSFQGTLTSNLIKLHSFTSSLPYAGDPMCKNDPQCPAFTRPTGTPQITIQLSPYPSYSSQSSASP